MAERRVFQIIPSGTPDIFLVKVPFCKGDGNPFQIYLGKPGDSDAYILSDGQSVLRGMSGTTVSLRPDMLRQLVNSYGLKLSDQMMIFEDSSNLLDDRIARFLQTVIAIDGILRMWGLSSPTRAVEDAPREGRESGYAGTELAAADPNTESNDRVLDRQSMRGGVAVKSERDAPRVRTRKR